MLPWAAYPAPVRPPAQSWQPEPVKVAALRRDEHSRDLGTGERGLHALRGRSAHHDRRPVPVRDVHTGLVGDVVQDERIAQLELALDGDLRNAPARGPEPALSHSVSD